MKHLFSLGKAHKSTKFAEEIFADDRFSQFCET